MHPTKRPAITKGVGLTATERYLTRLAERSFLNLWSYPNPYRDQGQRGVGDGKELCDLLVVCGRDIIIFSEKNIGWPGSPDVGTAWRRWAKRALLDATRQARGAERWITQFPNRVFLDRRCTERFPIALPEKGEAVIHLVVVGRGAGEACKQHFGDEMGSLRVRPEIVGEQHWAPESEPFAIGDLNPSGTYVHVMDDTTLDIVLGELDTVLDFTEYLTKKAAFLRSGGLASAAGEQDLLAHYAVRMNEHDEHDFVENGTLPGPLHVEPGLYGNFERDPRYIARKRADAPSYFWDRLIESFTNHIIDGTSVILDGHDYDLKKLELGVRYMALQCRVVRRGLGGTVAEALTRGAAEEMFLRAIVVPAGLPECETGFFVLTMKRLDWMKRRGSYEDYRKVRANAALIYAQGLLARFPHLERVVGVACEPAIKGQGGSEELIYVEQAQWSQSDLAAIEEDCGRLGIFQEGTKVRRWHDDEYPRT